jgi:hypothetical protein
MSEYRAKQIGESIEAVESQRAKLFSLFRCYLNTSDVVRAMAMVEDLVNAEVTLNNRRNQ